jgi:hypothetical protein
MLIVFGDDGFNYNFSDYYPANKKLASATNTEPLSTKTT